MGRSEPGLNHEFNLFPSRLAMDASARPGAGFVWGNNMWLGSRRGCESLNVPLSITLTPRFSRIMQEDLIRAAAPNKFQYVMVYAKHNSPWQIEEKFLEEVVDYFIRISKEIV